MKNPARHRITVYTGIDRPGYRHSSTVAPMQPSIQTRHVRAPRPPNTRSVTHPPTSIPNSPDPPEPPTHQTRPRPPPPPAKPPTPPPPRHEHPQQPRPLERRHHPTRARQLDPLRLVQQRRPPVQHRVPHRVDEKVRDAQHPD